MLKLLLLCLGTSVLLILSQNNNPVQRSYWGRTRHFFRDPADIYMVIAIFWMAAFAFLRTNYNDTAAYINGFRNARSLSEGFASASAFSTFAFSKRTTESLLR